MSKEKEELERLIADIENMTDSQRLVFIELLLRSFSSHDLPLYLGIIQEAVGKAQFAKNCNLLKSTVLKLVRPS